MVRLRSQSQDTLLLPPVVFVIIRGWKKKRKKKTRSTAGNVAFNIGFFFSADEKAGINNEMKEKSFTRKILLEICISFLKESWKHTVSTHTHTYTQRVRVCVQTLKNTHTDKHAETNKTDRSSTQGKRDQSTQQYSQEPPLRTHRHAHTCKCGHEASRVGSSSSGSNSLLSLGGRVRNIL